MSNYRNFYSTSVRSGKLHFYSVPDSIASELSSHEWSELDRAANLMCELKDRTDHSVDIYMNSRNISEDWRETFAKWGYVPCLD